ncbi:MAG: DEAD/DEAH box helicase [Balneola sp.]|jgi:ATP-dependent RNA helicase RhlE|nr:DEAD/DEAH box helicase [Balneola sp.]MBE80164.1 DEAD/DEAH box helicase [Balneola sp.]HBX64721.1 DEAD/DEAH box helicase [Balneolaceae bacterium]|tara:strand:- start:1696 stop:2979 length:1284 start_codon:yes stop_codon:yes gene_type:complete
MSFKSLNLSTPILKSLEEEGYTHPTPIQSQAIPIALKGTDVLGCAQTGTGKTAAFAIPILQLLSKSKSRGQNRKIRSLIVTPTRELAIQIDESFKSYGRYTNLETTVVFGGVSQKGQVKKLNRGVDILTATPGRLLDLMNQGFISLSDIEIFVLDEADRMLDMGFIHDIKKLLKVIPNKRQTLFFSATMPNEIVKLSKSMLNNPTRVEVTPESSTVEIIEQGIYYVDKGNKKNLLVDVLKEAGSKSALVFTRTKHRANKVVKLLNSQNIQAEAIHGNKSQKARQRALGNFKDQATRVLVATDIAARGIDVDELQYVINYEIPNVPETYVHRIGRTGRAGAEGTALSFCDAEEKAYVKDIEKLIDQNIPVIDDHKYPMTDHNPAPAEKQKRRPSRKHKSEKRKTSNGGNPRNNNKKRRRKSSNNSNSR